MIAINGLMHHTEKIEKLKDRYPAVYFAFLKTCGRSDEARALYDGTLTVNNMSWYIQTDLIPRMNLLRANGKLKSGEKLIHIDDMEFKYIGEIDEKGLACGLGCA